MIKPKEEPVNGKRPEAPQTTESMIKQVSAETPVKEAEGLLSNTGSSKKLDKKQVQTKKGPKKSSEKSAEEKTQKPRKREVKAKDKTDVKVEKSSKDSVDLADKMIVVQTESEDTNKATFPSSSSKK